MDLSFTDVANPLTRTGGYLAGVTSHSLQPYRGCPLGSSLCGVGCYVQHNPWLTRGRRWGSFLEIRQSTAQAYLSHAPRERRWAHRKGSRFSIFLASSTEPFPPQERRYGVTAALLEAMLVEPPDELVVQTHSAAVTDHRGSLLELSRRCRLRVHVSIESDRETLPGLPPPGSPVARRFDAARTLHEAGLETVITVAPLLPLLDAETFFRRAAASAGALVLDHFVGGDGTPDGRRTHRTALPAAMEAVEPGSSSPEYLERVLEIARRVFPGPIGVGADGFAARYRAGAA
ncbi:MAG: hypothetical protein KDD11_02670 [Acidobacteria bacterium]|nr:hypothetical protein [Acidobacteriota bacterium]